MTAEQMREIVENSKEMAEAKEQCAQFLTEFEQKAKKKAENGETEIVFCADGDPSKCAQIFFHTENKHTKTLIKQKLYCEGYGVKTYCNGYRLSISW